jgi:hypothetical protein
MKIRKRVVSNRLFLLGPKGSGFYFLLSFFCFCLAACETCVNGMLTNEGVPLEWTFVEVLDESGGQVCQYWTGPDGKYCCDNLSLFQNLTLHTTFNYEDKWIPFNTGTSVGSCEFGNCMKIDLNFACDPQDLMEPNNTCEKAKSVLVPYSNPLTSLCPVGDVDFYLVEVAEEDMLLVAESFYPGSGVSFDSYMGLIDGNCNLLVTDDDGGSGLYSRIVYPLPSAGIYYIAVTRLGDDGFTGDHGSAGTYGIDIQVAYPACVQVKAQENGRSLEGAWVHSMSSPYESCTTDAAGSCCFTAAVGNEECYEIGHPTTWDYLYACATPEDPGDCEQGDCTETIADFDYTCVSGSVTRDGEPVEDAEVCGYYGCTNTEPEGLYCVRTPENSETEIRAEDPVLCETHHGVVVTGIDGTCTDGGCVPLEFDLPAISCVKVTVTRDRLPVEGAWIYPPSGCQYGLPTGEDGEACFPARADSEILLRVTDPLFGGDKFTVVETKNAGSCEEGRCTKVEVALTGKACARGTVYWGDGESAANVRVTSPGYGPGIETQTDPNGNYCIVVPKGEEVPLWFFDPVYGQDRIRYVTANEGGSCEEGGCATLDVTFPLTSCVSGAVSRLDGQPPTGVKVCLGYWDALCADPDQEGIYCLRAPVNDATWIQVQDPVTGTWKEEYVETGGASTCVEGDCAEVNFELPAMACVNGFVTRAGGNGELSEPQEGVRVCLGYPEDVCVETTGGGQYCLQAPVDTYVSVEVSDPILGEGQFGYVETKGSGSCDTGDCATMDFQLRGATCIIGVVREGRKTLEGAEVSAGFARVLTDRRGRYCLPALANQVEHWIQAIYPVNGSYLVEFPSTGSGGGCNEGGCTTQNFTFGE